MSIQHTSAQELAQDVSIFRGDQTVSHPEDSSFLEQFRPAPLSWLVAWLFRPRHEQAPEASEHFEEHINGLA